MLIPIIHVFKTALITLINCINELNIHTGSEIHIRHYLLKIMSFNTMQY